jgi:dienelactone hydrolase
MKTLLLVLAAALAAVPSQAALKSRDVMYSQGGTQLQGYLAWDDSFKGPRPGVLVFHEWWGFGPYVKMRADMLAGLGYVAFAADMYGKGVYAKDHEEAGKLMSQVAAQDLIRPRAQAALAQLAGSGKADTARVAAIGYCFGGKTALELARSGAPVKGVVVFHGPLDTRQPAAPGFRPKVLALEGADDKHVAGGIPAFEDEMRKAGADWQLTLYGGAVHSFTVKEAGSDPSTGMAYNAEADRRSWAAMRDFLAQTLK